MIHFVLVNPLDGANVGAVCRVMMNMGLENLHIVGGESIDERRVKTLALHAWDVWKNRRNHPDLRTALREFSLTAGTTRRRGRWRKYHTISPEDLADKIADVKNGDVGIVFGNESHGLTDEELNECNIAVTIPSAPAYPSLNLSHAAGIVAYELFISTSPAPLYTPIPGNELHLLVGEITNALQSIGFYSLTGKEEMARYLRDILARSLLDKREAERLKKIFYKIRDLKIHRGN